MIHLSCVIYLTYTLTKAMKKRFFKALTFWKTRESRQCTCFENKFLECPYLDNLNDIKAFVQCQKHEKQFLYYCCSHTVFCCDQCIMEGHRGCEKEQINTGTEQKETVDILYRRYMNLREYSLELSSQIAGLVTTKELLESFRGKRYGNIQSYLRTRLIECAMFEAECLNLLRLFHLSPSHTDRLILLKTIAVLDNRICEFLLAVSKLTPEKYTRKILCLCGNTVQNAPNKGKLRAVILDTAVTHITHRFVNDLEKRLKNKDVNVAYAGPCTGYKMKDASLPLLVVCSGDTRVEQDVEAALTKVQCFGLHRVGLLVLCVKGHHNRSSVDQNRDLGYLSYISCMSGHYELSKKQLEEIKSFLIEQKASGTPV